MFISKVETDLYATGIQPAVGSESMRAYQCRNQAPHRGDVSRLRPDCIRIRQASQNAAF